MRGSSDSRMATTVSAMSGRSETLRAYSMLGTSRLNPAVEEAGVKALDASGASLHLRDWPLLLLTPTAMSMAL